MRARCFSKEDRLLMAERVRKNETGIQNKEFKVRGFSTFATPELTLVSQTYQVSECSC